MNNAWPTRAVGSADIITPTFKSAHNKTIISSSVGTADMGRSYRTQRIFVRIRPVKTGRYNI